MSDTMDCVCRDPTPISGKWILVNNQGCCSRCGRSLMTQDNGMDVVARAPDVLDEARSIINGQRQDDYGSPKHSFITIAGLWTEYLTSQLLTPITPKEVAGMMILLKIARGTKKRDNWLDIIGYAAIAADRL